MPCRRRVASQWKAARMVKHIARGQGTRLHTLPPLPANDKLCIRFEGHISIHVALLTASSNAQSSQAPVQRKSNVLLDIARFSVDQANAIG